MFDDIFELANFSEIDVNSIGQDTVHNTKSNSIAKGSHGPLDNNVGSVHDGNVADRYDKLLESPVANQAVCQPAYIAPSAPSSSSSKRHSVSHIPVPQVQGDGPLLCSCACHQRNRCENRRTGSGEQDDIPRSSNMCSAPSRGCNTDLINQVDCTTNLDNQTTAVQGRLRLVTTKVDRATQAKEKLMTLIAKDELLDPIEDDDHLDELTDESPYDHLFSDIQNSDDCLGLVQYYGTDEFVVKAKQLITKYKSQLRVSLSTEPANVQPFELDLKEGSDWYENKAHKLSARLQSRRKLEATRDFIKKALEEKVIEPSQAESWSQILLTPKPNGSWRFCVDYRHLNKNTKSMGWPLPLIRQMLERIGSKRPKVFAVFDLTQGYNQAAISKKSRPLTAFRTAEGLFQWTRLPMGLKGAPAFFQHAMQHKVLSNYLYSICEVYLDDIIIYADDENELLENIEKVLERLKKFNITLNPAKVKIGMNKVEYVGHTVDAEGLHFSDSKREEVWNTPQPETQKQLKSFLGLCVQFKDHIRQYSDIGSSATWHDSSV